MHQHCRASVGARRVRGQQAQAPVDDSPANPTAVLETMVTNAASWACFRSRRRRKVLCALEQRRDDHSIKGTGTFSGFLVNSVVGGADSTITRLDNDRLWMLNHRKKEYRECPAHGCPVRSAEEKRKRARREPKLRLPPIPIRPHPPRPHLRGR